MEYAFNENFDPVVSDLVVTPGMNEYGFVKNDAIDNVDVLGGGILCDCTLSAPPMGAEIGPVWQTAPGGAGGKVSRCTSSNQGATLTFTNPSGACANRMFTPSCFNCLLRTCTSATTYSCSIGKIPNGRWKGKPTWVVTGFKIIKNCP